MEISNDRASLKEKHNEKHKKYDLEHLFETKIKKLNKFTSISAFHLQEKEPQVQIKGKKLNKKLKQKC